MRRVVNVYCCGRLAYTGPLDRAAERFDTTERALTLTIDNRLLLANPAAPRFYQTPDGKWPRETRYTAKWRDCA